MQTLDSLSTIEAEYNALSSSLREVISVLNLLNKLKPQKFQFNHSTPVVKCHPFEDNKNCIDIATNHKTCLRIKHLYVCLRHFCSRVIDETISIEHILTFKQISDIFTKPLACNQFSKLRNILMGWSVNMKE